MWYKQRVRGKVQDILRDSCRYSELVWQRVDDIFREKENEKKKNGKERMVFLTPYRIRREQDSKCGVMKIPSFFCAKQYDKRPQNNDTLIVQTRMAYRYTCITTHLRSLHI